MIAWTLVYILASCGIILTPCLIKFYRKNLRLEKENNDLMDSMITREVRFTKLRIKYIKLQDDYEQLKRNCNESTSVIF